MRNVALLFVLATTISPTLAWWKQLCGAPIIVERADPIISPGTPSGHVHTITGGSAFNINLTYSALESSNCTTCIIEQDKSAYWVPQLYYQTNKGTFVSVNQVGGITIYTQQRNNTIDEKIHAFPEGFRMVAGNPTLRSFNNSLEQQAIDYVCLDYNGPPRPRTNNFPPYNCPDGLRSQIAFPQCWNGKLDSHDHKSHVAYPDGLDHGKCPSTHPKRLMYIFYEVIWDTNRFVNNWYGKNQPFVWAMGDPLGYGYHGDFYNGWNVTVLQKAINKCNIPNDPSGAPENCGVFKLQQGDYGHACHLQKRPIKERVLGALTKLPGCNPVTRQALKPGTVPTC